MIRRSHSEIIDFNEGDNDSDSIIIKSYCKHCEKFGFKVPLKNRIYQNEPIPVDHENWLQCHECGSVIPAYSAKQESEIKDVVETSDNPFDTGKDFLGIDSRTSVGGKNARKKRERQKQLEDIKDDEVKREIAKGNTLISYTEYQPE